MDRWIISLAWVLMLGSTAPRPSEVLRFPADKATGVNPDTLLVLTFPSAPALGNSGQIRIYDSGNNRLVDTLDLSIPPGPASGAAGPAPPYTPTPYGYGPGRATNANTVPGTPSGAAAPTPRNFQLTIIGGFQDGFHFYPVIVHGNVATIHPHNNLLQYNKTYNVEIDPGVLTVAGGSFNGVQGKTGWTFTTKRMPPPGDSSRIVVSADGRADFNSVQGAIDFVPDRSSRRITIFIRNGNYEEIVYFRNKTNLTLLGEDREKVVVFYANNEVFNPHPANISTNEWPGTFPSRRAAFMGDNVSGVQLVNMTIRTTARGQAEGLLLMGEKNILSQVTVVGSGDALQVNGPVYITDSLIVGDGDTILGRGPAFFNRSELQSNGVFMWIRNTAANHGNVFLDCTFRKRGAGTTEIARDPVNNGRTYPNAEAVLINARLEGISPAGWGAMGGDTSNMHYWEFNSTSAIDGTPIDVTQRKPESRQLTKENDAATIANYSNPAYVLGWTPSMAPLILSQPAPLRLASGQPAAFQVKAAAIPDATYQWFKNGVAIPGAKDAVLKLPSVKPDAAGRYSVAVTNSSGTATSNAATLTVR